MWSYLYGGVLTNNELYFSDQDQNTKDSSSLQNKFRLELGSRSRLDLVSIDSSI